MDISKGDISAVSRDASGRFLPGRSGNPAGKKPGTRNRATAMRELLADGDEMALARAVIDKARAGDAVSARFVLGLVCPRPRPRGRAIALDLPEGARAGDTVAAFNATLQAMAAGEITPDEAVTVTRMLDGRREALNAFKLERELTRFHGDFIDGDELFRPAAERFREPDEIAAAADEDAAAGNESEDVVVETHALTEPSPPGRGQGEGWRSACDGDDPAAANNPHPDPLPEGEGIAAAAAETEPSPPGRGQGEGWRSAYDSDALHSACIEQDLQARAAARRAAERKLAQWSYLIATEPGFDAEAFIAAEIQRSAALNRSSAALPGQSSPSPRALNGVSTVLR